ncbi:MAG: hypothetical protein EBU90_17765 [Proteobacteria bacterium]|nr:hypothetical protein [Pseudomonadota bacterium]
MCVQLKIKSKHLTLESKVIRHEEKKLQKQLQWHMDKNPGKSAWEIKEARDVAQTLASVTDHRKIDVRNENRATFLARAYLAGKTYNYVESAKRREEKEYTFIHKVLPRVVTMVNKYKPRKSPEVTIDTLKEWCIIDE